jgi:hypothetical protein
MISWCCALPQAISWLRARLSGASDSPVELVAQHDARFVNSLELAVRFGKVSV